MKYKTNIYIEETDDSLKVLEKSIKLALCMAMINGKDSEEKFNIIKHTLIDYFKLEDYLDDSDIHLIFVEAVDREYLTWTIKDIQTYCLAFISSVRNFYLKYALVDLLQELSMFNGEATRDEGIIYHTFLNLVHTEVTYDTYELVLQKVDKITSTGIYTRKCEQKHGFIEKIKNTYSFRKKLKSAIKTYANGVLKKDIIAVYESLMLNDIKKKFLITKYAIVTTQDENFSVIPFGSIYSVVNDDDVIRLFPKPVDGGSVFELGTIPRIDNLSILTNIFTQIAEVNIAEDEKEEAV